MGLTSGQRRGVPTPYRKVYVSIVIAAYSLNVNCVIIYISEPGPVKDLISIYPSVLWQVPQEPNGIILDYQLTFTRNGQTTVASTNGPETYFIVRPELLPEGSGSFQVEVSYYTGKKLFFPVSYL